MSWTPPYEYSLSPRAENTLTNISADNSVWGLNGTQGWHGEKGGLKKVFAWYCVFGGFYLISFPHCQRHFHIHQRQRDSDYLIFGLIWSGDNICGKLTVSLWMIQIRKLSRSLSTNYRNLLAVGRKVLFIKLLGLKLSVPYAGILSNLSIRSLVNTKLLIKKIKIKWDALKKLSRLCENKRPNAIKLIPTPSTAWFKIYF